MDFSSRGFAIISVVISISLISAVILGIVLFTSLSQMKQTRHFEKVQLVKYAYESGLKRASWEIAFNPKVHDDIASGKTYKLPQMIINGLKVDVTISEDADGDGQFDVAVLVHN